MIDFKNARLQPTGARPICARHVQIGADIVTDNWEDKLQEQGKAAEMPRFQYLQASPQAVECLSAGLLWCADSSFPLISSLTTQK